MDKRLLDEVLKLFFLIVCSSLIVSSFFVNSYLEIVSFMPFLGKLRYISVIVCAFALSLYIENLKKTFYGLIVVCFLSAVITSLILMLPSSLGIIPETEAVAFVAIREFAVMFLYIFPCSFFGMAVGEIVNSYR